MTEVSVAIPKEVIEYITKLKAKAIEIISTTKGSEAVLSKEGAKYKKILDSMMKNCDGDVVVGLSKILSVMTGESIKPSMTAKGKGHINGLIAVPVGRNPNGHDYPIGQPLMIIHGDMGFEATGRMGNHLPPMGTALKVASEDEVDAFFDGLALSLAIGARGQSDLTRYLHKFSSDRSITDLFA